MKETAVSTLNRRGNKNPIRISDPPCIKLTSKVAGFAFVRKREPYFSDCQTNVSLCVYINSDFLLSR